MGMKMNVSFQRTSVLGLTAVAILVCAGRASGAAPESKTASLANPYATVDWDKVEFLHSFSHQHGHDLQVFWDMGFGHLPMSNYYPSRPVYPLPEAFAKKYPDALGAPMPSTTRPPTAESTSARRAVSIRRAMGAPRGSSRASRRSRRCFRA